MSRGSRWTLKQEQDIHKLWNASLPIILGALHNPSMAPMKKLDVAMAVVQKFGMVQPPPPSAYLGPAPKFIFYLNGAPKEVSTTDLTNGSRLAEFGLGDSVESINGGGIGKDA